jgi:hypothetical protein
MCRLLSRVLPGSAAVFCLLAAPAAAGERYYTDFESFAPGFDTLVGSDGWQGSSAHNGLRLSGIDAESMHGVIGLGNAAFLGGNTAIVPLAAGRTVNVRRNVGIDPSALGEEVVTFRCLVGIKDSTGNTIGTRRDNFEFAIYNTSSQLLGSIQFDNSTLDTASGTPKRNIYRTQWNTALSRFDLVNTNAVFLHDTIQQLEIRINFLANRWSLSLDAIDIFDDLPFHTGPRIRNLGPIAAQLQIVGTSLTGSPQPGDNYLLFDDWLVRTDPPAIPQPAISRSAANGAVTLTFPQEAGYQYLVQFSPTLSDWQSSLPGAYFTASTTGTGSFTDTTASGKPTRFYRITRSFP